jgi:hypothetical protein
VSHYNGGNRYFCVTAEKAKREAYASLDDFGVEPKGSSPDY